MVSSRASVCPNARDLFDSKMLCYQIPTEWKKIFANDTSDKGLIPKKELIQLNGKNKTSVFKNMSRGPEQTFLQRGHTNG